MHKILEFDQATFAVDREWALGQRMRTSLAQRRASARHDVANRLAAFWVELGQFGDDDFGHDEHVPSDLCSV